MTVELDFDSPSELIGRSSLLDCRQLLVKLHCDWPYSPFAVLDDPVTMLYLPY